MKVLLPFVLAVLLASIAQSEEYYEYIDSETQDPQFSNDEDHIINNQTLEETEDKPLKEVTFKSADEDYGIEDTEIKENEDDGDNSDSLVDACGYPPAVENAKVNSNSEPPHPIGTSLSYTCEFGYTADGASHTTHCIQPGKWTDPNIVCIPRSCGEPGFVPNAHRLGSRFTFPNSISFECDDGYELRGNNVRYCQVNGRWSGSLPSCTKISCDPPDDPANGRVSYASLDYLSQLHYECNKGYLLKNHQTRICLENGTWSGTQPLCLEAQCDPAVAPEHGFVETTGGIPRIGSIAIYTCESGKRLIGSGTSKCLDIGEWTFPTPKCVEPCNIPTVPNGYMGKYRQVRRNSKQFVRLDPGTKVEERGEVYLRCKSNYEPLGKDSTEEKITCENGDWVKIPVCEPASCKSDPPPMENGRPSSINRRNGGGVVYRCNNDFTKKKYGNVTCVSGSWRGQTPVCADRRCYLDQIKFPGLVLGKKNVYLNQESFMPTCEDGYDIAKPKKIVCDQGSWRGHFPPCTAASCEAEPPLTENGRAGAFSGIHSSVVTYECDEGYFLQQKSPVQCLFGEWKGSPPLCRNDRCNFYDLKLRTGLIAPEDKFTNSGSTLDVQCASGYSRLSVKPICTKGVWTEYGTSPCKENNCNVYEIENGELTSLSMYRKLTWKGYVTESKYEKVRKGTLKPAGSSLYVTCNYRFSFQGSNRNNVKTVCTKGQWKPEPVCLPPGTLYREKAANPPSTRGTTTSTTTTETTSCFCTYLGQENLVGYAGNELLQTGSKVAIGSSVLFYCKNFGYDRLVGPSEIACKKCETWHSSEYPDCMPPIRGDTIVQLDPHLKILPGGVLSLEQGVDIQILCIGNGVANYPDWLTPSTGETFTFEYLDYVGGQPRFSTVLVIPNSSLHHSGKYSCALTGYRNIILDIQVTAQCRKFEEREDLQIHYDLKQNVNSSAMFTCKDRNKKLEGVSVMTCLSNGQWSGEMPNCNAAGCPKFEEKEGTLITYSHELNVGSTATFHCFVPYVRKGDSNLRCLRNGQWSGNAPSCMLSTCSVENLFQHIPEGIVPVMDNVNNNTLPHGFELPLTCEYNLRLAEPAIAKCGNEGTWQVPTVRCVPGCGAVAKQSDSRLIVEPEKDFYRFGEFVALSCSPGQQLDAEVEILMCLSEGWSEREIPNCIDI